MTAEPARSEGERRPEPLMREALEEFGEYQRTGDRPSLVRAVPLFRAALAAAIRVGVPDPASYHNNLGYARRELAVATGNAAAQAEAVGCLRAAVAGTDPDDPDRTPYLCSLSSALRDLYRYTKDAKLLRTAVRVATAATESAGLEPSLASRSATYPRSGSRGFHTALVVPGRPGSVDVNRAAIALHHATRRLRDRYPDSPAIWAGHIHTGP